MPETSQHSQRVPLAEGRELSVTWAGTTDTGRRRETNQDAFLAEYPLFVVADGMGGHAGGEIASQATIGELRGVLAAGEVTPGTIEAALERATEAITSHPEATDEGTGTTLTGVFLTDVDGQPRWMSLNIGDSRVYLLRDGAISQVTTDHSVVQELISSGRLSPEEAEGHPYSNVITRAVGASDLTVPDYVSIEPHDGDVFVICSDGLTKELTDYGILHFVTGQPEPAAAVDAMLSAALENGGRDNVTLIVVRVSLSGGDVSSTDEETVE
ncbi:PP2C family protein-serine/threonine phosphatase [Microbacterium sp. NIBRBAC000506063]|uniref:PP2C family protein-serine/threonine phosphatase n=1 Tax=Microbacterium sp. NIBRBAC000506063 TaxID=2734618 RepID=UPI001BB68F96|nr:protein phosphatase 2C domain-containing protein [Microbacterium sp. NIBRBAC000506063]QTV79517.1 serine/threonine-protein phosphatase [Microbacterium sp. NIBRBAC000506063]